MIGARSPTIEGPARRATKQRKVRLYETPLFSSRARSRVLASEQGSSSLLVETLKPGGGQNRAALLSTVVAACTLVSGRHSSSVDSTRTG